ncbi:MAG: SCO family protein [Solirubrobacteraceae bacterium]
MNLNNRRLQGAMGTLLVLLLLAVGALLLLRPSSHLAPSTGTAAVEGSTGPGPFLTASTLPPGLAGRAVPSFHLADARGGRLASTSLHGHPYALTFLYVHCVDVCPLIGSEIHTALADLGPKARKMRVVAVSVDPRGDTRRAVREWLTLHQEPANFHYLIGSEQALAPVWKAFYVSPQIPGDPHSSHTAVIWLINRRGKVQALISAGIPINVANLAHDFGVLIQQA